MRWDLITSYEALDQLTASFKERGVFEVAVDFEGDYNLHCYGMRLCLVQLFDGRRCYLVDTITVRRLDPLWEFFKGPIQKVMFAPSSDLTLLDHLGGFHMSNLYDLQSAAKLLGMEQLALSKVLEQTLEIKLPRGKKNQRANWTARPLRASLLEYAAHDVLHLLDLKAALHGRIVRTKKAAALEQENRKLERTRYRPKKNPHLGIRGARGLNHQQRVILKHLYAARDRAAQDLDWGPNRLLRNDVLIRLAKKPPPEARQWKRQEGFHPRGHCFIPSFMAAIQEAREELGQGAAGKPAP